MSIVTTCCVPQFHMLQKDVSKYMDMDIGYYVTMTSVLNLAAVINFLIYAHSNYTMHPIVLYILYKDVSNCHVCAHKLLCHYNLCYQFVSYICLSVISVFTTIQISKKYVSKCTCY